MVAQAERTATIFGLIYALSMALVYKDTLFKIWKAVMGKKNYRDKYTDSYGVTHYDYDLADDWETQDTDEKYGPSEGSDDWHQGDDGEDGEHD